MNASSMNRGFLLRWIGLCGLGLAVGIGAALGLSTPIEAIVGMMLVTPIVFAIAGSLLGAVQWLALWRDLRAGVIWVGASAIGFAVGMTIGVVSVEVLGRAITGEPVRLLAAGPLERSISLAWVGTIAGLAVGVTQRIALRATATSGTRWLLSCVLGFGVGLPVAGLVGGLMTGGLGSMGGVAIFLGIAGGTIGAFTARNANRIAARSV